MSTSQAAAKVANGSHEARRETWNTFPLREETNFADTLILDFCPAEL